jgi:hypothetical protein
MMSDLDQIPPLPGNWPPRDAEEDYFAAITDAITNHPRSLQKRIGPSEIGTPCARKLAYKLAGFPEKPGEPNWKATVGTGIHAWLEDAFDRANLTWAKAFGNQGVERWLIEEKVTVGLDANGQPITGSCDLYDRHTRTVIDHKTIGPTQLRKYRTSGPGRTYRTQAHLYGQGWANAGMPPAAVAICFLPRQGELRDAHWWAEPWDPEIATQALERLRQVQTAVETLGPTAFQALPTFDDYCSGCPFHNPRSTDPAVGCPGHPTATPARDCGQPALTLVTA